MSTLDFLTLVVTKVEHLLMTGGVVVSVIMLCMLTIWLLVLERWVFFRASLQKERDATVLRWQQRSERTSRQALAIRQKYISELHIKIEAHLPLVKTLVSLCPLLGLLGTVAGMNEVFNVLAITAGGNAQLIAGSIAKATIPTMVGMVAAITGLIGNTWIARKAGQEVRLTEQQFLIG